MKRFVQTGLSLALLISTSAMAQDIPETFETSIKDIQFNRDIRPILSDKCFQCHGTDANTREAELRLDIEEDAKRDREGTLAVNAGNPQESSLVARIFASDPDDAMPPADSGKALTDAERNLLAAWIQQGAEYQPHWAYVSPKKPTIAKGYKNDWGVNPIDYFVKKRLDAEGLTPSPKADPITLVRRLHHDLTGLPPAPELVDRFKAKATARTYAKLVDDLLASPQYGERMAINWLDQVRYADSNGYHSDEERTIFPYRDYVIKSFNENKPFDQFTIEQLAGDLLENPTQEQRIATGFNRLNQITREGGAQSKEYRAKYNADRVRALGSVWMGATLGCAECHAHKFDPYDEKDFYRFAAFFADIEEEDVYGDSAWRPILRLTNEEQDAKIKQFDADIEALENQLRQVNMETQYGAKAWLDEWRSDPENALQQWIPLIPTSMTSENNGTFILKDDLSILSVGLDAPQDVYQFEFKSDLPEITSLRFDIMDHPSFHNGLSRYRSRTQLNECEITYQTPDMPEAKSVKIVGDYFSNNFNKNSIRSTYDNDMITNWGRGADRTPFSWMYLFDTPIPGGKDTVITIRMHYLGIATGDRAAFGRIRVSATQNEQPNITNPVGLPHPIALAVAAKRPLTVKEQAIGLDYFLSSDPQREDTRKQLAKLHTEKRTFKNSLPYTLHTVALPIPRDIRVLPRGDWQDDSGPLVEPGVPAFLPPLKSTNDRPNRLDLAHWLIDKNNPLTARVFMNRLWKLYFGTGISGQLEELGNQGESPSHPELLDWLALEFIDSGWDIKHMVRLIVSSEAYRQSSVASDELLERDPKNRLLARQSTFRYEAEMVRDTALALGGILNTEIGGPSARPYQPAGYWQHLNFPKRTYKHDENKAQYRRGLYVHWQRSFLHPSMMAFDAPSREECVAERTMSNTPLQALTLLNDPTYVEAARAFAERIINNGGATPQEKVHWAMRQGVLRAPNAEEVQLLSQVYESHRATYTQNTDAITSLLGIGMNPAPEEVDKAELAAWTSVARIILNLHETITRS